MHLDVDAGIIITLINIYRCECVNYIIVVLWCRIGSGGGGVSHVNRMIIGFVICGQFIDKLSDCCLLEDESAAYG